MKLIEDNKRLHPEYDEDYDDFGHFSSNSNWEVVWIILGMLLAVGGIAFIFTLYTNVLFIYLSIFAIIAIATAVYFLVFRKP